jgi:hypothetical protein
VEIGRGFLFSALPVHAYPRGWVTARIIHP